MNHGRTVFAQVMDFLPLCEFRACVARYHTPAKLYHMGFRSPIRRSTLYWDSLARHRDRFATHPRMRMVLKHVDAMSPQELETIRDAAAAFRGSLEYDATR